MKIVFSILVLLSFLLACHPPSPVHDSDTPWWTDADRKYILDELNRTTRSLLTEIQHLSDEQWQFREDSSRWNILQIVEHLEMQNQLHFREISVISLTPQKLIYRNITDGQDPYFKNYATDTIRSKAKWFLEPKGKFTDKNACMNAFLTARTELVSWVRTTSIDLRKQYTFRANANDISPFDMKIGQVRDLHQLLLTGIAHTDRHIQQIRNLKDHLEFPIQ